MIAEAQSADLERIARALRGKEIGGGTWSCRCPAHEDKVNSLAITIKEGKLLWRCHAGCPQAHVQAALEELKLLERKREPRHVNGQARPTPSGRALRAVDGGKAEQPGGLGKIVATYDYVDVTGELLFQVVRFSPKTFRQRRPKGGGWEWSLGQTKRVLYRLPLVLAAETVLVVEGEKDAERLIALGLVATTSPMGADKWRSEYGEALAGKHVIVLPDNDPIGKKHAGAVAGSAREHNAASVRIVELPKLPEHGDVSTWLDTGGTREQLEALVRAAPQWGLESETGGDPGWRARLIAGDQGPLGNEANVKIALTRAPELVGRLRFDAFRSTLQCRDVPWYRLPEWRDWTDEDDVELAVWCQEQDINIPSIRIGGVALAVGKALEHHPVRDYLRGLKWDGEPRLDDWMNLLLGVSYRDQDHMRYVQAISARWMIQAVARAMDPGCKADCALILEGEQGRKKSSALRLLAGAEWFTDQISDLGSKDSSEDLRGKWIIEFAELKSVRGPEVEKIKAFLSRSVDHYRPPYARRARDFLRQCVFAGSTNEDQYLHDRTGNRRFWPARVERIDLVRIAEQRDQLWAEAAARYDKGEQWWLTEDETIVALREQSSRTEEDTWTSFIHPWLLGRTEVTTREVVIDCLGLEKKDINKAQEMRIAQSLRDAGFRSTERRHPIYGARIYVRQT